MSSALEDPQWKVASTVCDVAASELRLGEHLIQATAWLEEARDGCPARFRWVHVDQGHISMRGRRCAVVEEIVRRAICHRLSIIRVARARAAGAPPPPRRLLLATATPVGDTATNPSPKGLHDVESVRRSPAMWPSSLRAIVLLAAAATAVGADDVGDRQQWPLIYAAGEGDAVTVKKLLAEGVSVKQRSPDGESALHVAAIRGNLPTVRALLDAGAEVDARTPPGATIYMTPSMWAVYHGHAEMIALLLDAGADPGAADENGKTLLQMAQEAQQPAIEEMLRARLSAAEAT